MSISDELANAVDKIDLYLSSPHFVTSYGDPKLNKRIESVRDQMDGLRADLDRLPPQTIPEMPR